MKLQYKKSALLAVVIICLSVFGCKKFVDVDAPIDSIDTQASYDTDAKTGSVIRGLYLSMVKSTNVAYANSVTISLGLSADELTTALATYLEYYNNAVSPASTPVTNYLWGPMYNMIYTANSVIINVPNSTGMTEAGKKQYIAEAKFIRAVNYFYLVNLFGDVPLTTSTDYDSNSRLARTSTSAVYDLIVEDLKFAEANLAANYVGTTATVASPVRLRANKFAAAAFLARVYLYKKDWLNAEMMATEVIEGKNTAGLALYTLETTLNNVFLLGSREVILQLQQPATNLYTSEGASFVPVALTTIPSYQLTDLLYNSFPVGDLRKINWIRTSSVIATKTYYSPFKYKLNSGTGPVKTESSVFLRLAELYLIRAEARAQQNKLSGAILDIDAIRTRAGAVAVADVTKPFKTIGFSNPNISQPDLLTAIYNERFLELFAEQGHRWLDLKRTERADDVLKNKPNWRPEAKLLPIPSGEIKVDPAIIQNPGYNTL